MSSTILAAATAALFWAQGGGTTLPSRRPSVLMLIIDDLRASLPGGGQDDLLQLPHLARLAARGTTFTRAFAQYPLCSPSRSSCLTGLRPDTTRVTDLTTHFRAHVPSALSLPEAFRAAGYLTVGVGKVFHRGLGDDAHSWSARAQVPVDRPAYGLQANLDLDKGRKARSRAEHAQREVTASGGSKDILRGGKVLRGLAVERTPASAYNHSSFHDDVVAVETVKVSGERCAVAAPPSAAAAF